MFSKLKPLFSAADSFLREVPTQTKRGPHIRDSIDLKRVMTLVVISLIPCILVAIWNAGMQSLVYSHKDPQLMSAYIEASGSFSGYWSFSKAHFSTILFEGLSIFLPLVFISYAVGGFWEALFACVRGHEIAEGFLVSGILYPLILPPTIPYWMAALGISFGIIVAKELFGGTGMNILNPALTCRCFLYFTFPAYMTGEVWAGRTLPVDGYSSPSALSFFKAPGEIARIHIDAIGANHFHKSAATADVLTAQFQKWNQTTESFGSLSPDVLQKFSTASVSSGGLGLSHDNFLAAQKFAELKFGSGLFSDANLFFGNKLGSLGEVSIFACLLGALFLILTGIGSWRTMAAVILGAAVTALIFQIGSSYGAWNPALFDFPVYKHFLIGGLAF
jgi:Na+-transporting NADH:ubiquinone oxidoreductase subunit B